MGRGLAPGSVIIQIQRPGFFKVSGGFVRLQAESSHTTDTEKIQSLKIAHSTIHTRKARYIRESPHYAVYLLV